MIIPASRLRQFQKVDKVKTVEENEELVGLIQQHPYKEEIPSFEKDKVEPYLEDQDEIRALTILINQAKCAAIRDRQREEKKIIKESIEAYEEEMELEIVELGKENDTQLEQQRVLEKKKRQINSIEIKHQIVEKQNLKAKMDKEKTQEGLEANLKYKQQTELDAIKKRDVALKKQEFYKDIIAKNEEYSLQRVALKKKELLEDKLMLKTTMDKIAKDVELEKKKKLENFEKEKAFADSLVKHKQKHDKKDQKDEILALKAAYEFELKSRTQEADKKRKDAALKDQLIKERILLKELKEKAIQQEVQRSIKEYNDILQQQVALDLKMKDLELKKKKELDQFLIDIKNQIEHKRKVNKDTNEKLKVELAHFEKDIQVKQKMINDLKLKKVNELEQLGVPEKYLYDVAKFINSK